MKQDYIFCPLCGATKWTTTKLHKFEDHYTCSGCEKFQYINRVEHVKSESGLEYFQKRRYSVYAEIYPYTVSVYYDDNRTDFADADSQRIILSVPRAVAFNWYKGEDLVEKIKKYLLFS